MLLPEYINKTMFLDIVNTFVNTILQFTFRSIFYLRVVLLFIDLLFVLFDSSYLDRWETNKHNEEGDLRHF